MTQFQAGAIIANRYEVRGSLGHGSFGEVYLVFDHHQSLILALKMLDPTKIGRWPWRESQQLTRFNDSEYILRIWNADVVGGIPYIVTEFATGGTLATRLEQSPVAVDEAVSAVRHAARGIARCHDENVVHRDIKLENLFIKDYRTVVGDLGLAYPLDQRGEAPWAGTLTTQSPEVAMGGRTTKANDIYSLGACLYRLITGQHTYPASNRADFLAALGSGPPRSIRDVAPFTSRRLAAIVETAMARNPQNRYGSAAELDAALGRITRPDRLWAPMDHAEHEECWTQVRPSGPGIDVCTVVNQRRVDIVVRYSASRRRLRDHCHDRVPRGASRGRLRAIFEALGN